jgi:hypothetical protein
MSVPETTMPRYSVLYFGKTIPGLPGSFYHEACNEIHLHVKIFAQHFRLCMLALIRLNPKIGQVILVTYFFGMNIGHAVKTGILRFAGYSNHIPSPAYYYHRPYQNKLTCFGLMC